MAQVITQSPQAAKHQPNASACASGGGNTPVQLAGKRIHFMGIGGCGMSGLARLVQQRGGFCDGSDVAPSQVTTDLKQAGIQVTYQQTAQSLPADCDLLVVSAAIANDHPQVLAAQKRGIGINKYAQLLGQLMIGQTGVAIAGTHGKSTTTALLSHILIQTGKDPSLILGANCNQIGGGWRVGQSDLLIAEACEFDRSFHQFYPQHAAILNVEEDHLDVYDGIEQIVQAFALFAKRLPDAGSLLIQHELPDRLAITAGLTCKVQTIGFAPQADWQIQLTGGQQVTLVHQDKQVAAWQNPMPGQHMAYNAACAAVLSHQQGSTWPAIGQAIAQFDGLDRRMQCLTPPGSAITLIDDYGHHPTEIEMTLRALREHYLPQRLICIFQPHQHSRTRFLLAQFAASFSQADLVIVPHIYFVRDSAQERHAVRASDLVDRIRRLDGQAMHLYPFAAIVDQLAMMVRPGDLVVTMGAGNVWEIARDVLPRINRQVQR